MQCAVTGNASVIDKHIDRPEFLRNGCHVGVSRVEIRNVPLPCRNIGIALEVLGLGLVSEIIRDDGVPAALQQFRGGCADAADAADTTMGFTALDGLVMGTRSGNLDPGVILYLEQERGLTAKEIETLLYEQSGLLGVSGGLASDMRTLLASDDPRAKEAIELFVYRIAREVGALTSSLGGLDGLVFTAGIGEHVPEIARKSARVWIGWASLWTTRRTSAAR